MWDVEYTSEFEEWWDTLDEDEQESIAVSVRLLQERGPHLGYPHSSDIRSCTVRHLRELRTQHRGKPYRTLYAFDPRRTAILLLGGVKSGGKRWYEKHIPLAEKIYAEHLTEIGGEET